MAPFGDGDVLPVPGIWTESPARSELSRGTRQRTVSTTTHTSGSQTFEVLASARLTAGPSMVTWQELAFVSLYIVCFFGCKSSSFSVSI